MQDWHEERALEAAPSWRLQGSDSRDSRDSRGPEIISQRAAAPSSSPQERRSPDGWVPGIPSPRTMAPSVVGGAVIPLAVYYLVRHQVNGDAVALAIAGIPAAAWVMVQWVRLRHIDPVGAAVLCGFIAGLIVSTALGGDAFVLKVRDSASSFLLGVACLLSLRFRRPVMFYIGRSLSAAGNRARQAAYNGLWDRPGGPHVFRVITAVWGVGLIGDAGLRLVLASTLTTGVFLATSPGASTVLLSGLFAFSVWYIRPARRPDWREPNWRRSPEPAATPIER